MDIFKFNLFLKSFGLRLEGFGDLTKAADRYGSDKGFHNGHGHLYTQFYEKIFHTVRYEKFTLVEIGLLSAHYQDNFEKLDYAGLYEREHGKTYHHYPSLRMWADFFPHAKIIGLDKENFEINSIDDRIEYRHYNADNSKSILKVLNGEKPLIIVDDGSHIFKHQQETFFDAFPILAAGGIYVIEDLNSVQGNLRAGYPPTQSIFNNGVEGIKKSPAFQALPQSEKDIFYQISGISFSKSLKTGEINTVAIQKSH